MGENRAGLGAHGAAGLGASSPGGNIAVNGATEPVARVDLGEGGGSEIAVGSKGNGNGGASLGLGANCAEVLEQTLKPDQPEALASTEQVL